MAVNDFCRLCELNLCIHGTISRRLASTSRLSARPLFVGWTAGAEAEIILELVCYIRLSTEAN